MASIDVNLHLARAERHRKVGRALQAAGDEWSAVCYFYSAYHLLRFALRSDPIFDDLKALGQVHKTITMDERNTTRHSGRVGMGKDAREWGINELVIALYRPIAPAYHRLHQASISVRYEEGLIMPTMSRVAESLDVVWDAHEAGSLVAVKAAPGSP